MSGKGGWRRAAAIYLAFFFCAVAFAPHHHVNGLEDLLFDQPSDSGVILQPAAPPTRGAEVTPLRYVHDVPCLACFTRDFVTTPAATIALVTRLKPLPAQPAPSPISRPEPLPAETSSRAPPTA